MAAFSGGSMSSGGGSMAGMGADLGTLDEPVTETIMRDLRMVGNKMLCVLNPRKANMQTLKNWDLWGPLVLCLTLATLLSWFAPYEQKSLVFASVFVIVCCGATVVTVNALLLGGNISFFQSVCVLGYCIFPPRAEEVEKDVPGSAGRNTVDEEPPDEPACPWFRRRPGVVRRSSSEGQPCRRSNNRRASRPTSQHRFCSLHQVHPRNAVAATARGPLRAPSAR